MRPVTLSTPFRAERGIALPTAMIALALLTTLVIAFAVLSKSEPLIASNHARAVQARSLADAGLETGIWALTSTIIANPMMASIAAAPYDGSTPFTVGAAGTFRVTVSEGAAPNERVVDAVGSTPAIATGGATGRVRAIVNTAKWLDPPSALTVRGELNIAGNVKIDSRSDNSCGPKGGVSSADDTTITGNAADVYGYGNDVRNERTGDPADISDNIPEETFDQWLFADADLNMLRSLAKCCGTYIGPGSPASYTSQNFGPTGTPTILFNDGNKLPKNGLIFIDSKTGTNPTATTPDNEIPTVKITGDASPDGVSWKGWLIVMGKIVWEGHTKAEGFVYAHNDLSWAGTETIDGAVMSRNIKDVSSTNIDSDISGTTQIRYDCAAAKTGGGSLPTGWLVKAGSYREVSD